MFKKAVKSQAKLKMSLAGPSGSGKTYTALAIAQGLGKKIAVVDTEHGSASKYADLFDFDVLELDPPFHPNRFVEAIEAAAEAGYDVIILDSLSHAWNGSGGMLEIVDQISKRMRNPNSYMAWNEATPIQNKFIDAIVGAEVHLIATMRSKQAYALDQVEKNGRTVTVPRKVGMAPIQRDSFEYEFDVFAELDLEHNLVVSKTRCHLIDGGVYPKAGRELGETLADWLSDGEPAQPKPKPIKINTIGDLLHQLYEDFNLSEADAKAELKALNYTGFKQSKALEMYQAVADRANSAAPVAA